MTQRQVSGIAAYVARRMLNARPPDRPSATVRLLSPETWAPSVAKKLRAGESLDAWERAAAAECLEHAAGRGRVKAMPRRGRKPRYRLASGPPGSRELVDKMMYDAVMQIGGKHQRDGVYEVVAEKFRTTEHRPHDLTSAMVEKAFQREKRRRQR